MALLLSGRGCWRLAPRAAVRAARPATVVLRSGLRPKSDSISPGLHQTPIVDLLWRKRKEANEVKEAMASTPEASSMEGKTPEQSQQSVTYEFSRPGNEALVDKYRNPMNNVRPARLLEDLDALAGTIAFVHCQRDNGAELHIVTASVDRIKYMTRPKLTDDIVLSGKVTWVGRSSMEIQMRAEVAASGQPILKSLFTFVARDLKSGRAAQIPQLIVSGHEQEQLFALGAKRDAQRKQLRKQAQSCALGSRLDAEGNQMADALHDAGQPLLKMPMLTNPLDVFLHETKLENTFMTMPQQRNTAGRVFGGFLMRRAYELAFCCAHLFCGRRPIFHELDEVTFKAPVSIGDLVRFEACVLYTSGNVDSKGRATIHTEVRASVLKPEKCTFIPSNTFNFTFGVPMNADGTGPSALSSLVSLRRVLPATRQEAITIVERFVEDLRQKEEDLDYERSHAAKK